MPQRGSVRRAVFVFRGFYFFAGFVGRNNPLKPASFGHGAEKEVRVAGKDWQRSAEKISGGGRVGFLRFTFLNLFRYFVHAWIGRAQTSDGWCVLLDQTEKRDVPQIGRDAHFDNRFGLMLLRWIKLGEAWPQNMRLQEVSPGSRGSLLDLIVDQPDLRPVISGGVADENNLEKRLVGLELDRVMELRNERTQFFEESNADLLEILLGGAFGNEVGIDSAKMGDLTVESNGPGLRSDLPFGGAEQNADVAAVNHGDARGNGFGFERAIDGGEDDGVIGDVNDGAATGEIGDDFLFLGRKRGARRERSQENQRGVNKEVPHEGRVAQLADCGLGTGGGTVCSFRMIGDTR